VIKGMNKSIKIEHIQKKIDIIINLIILTFLFLIISQNFFIDALFESNNSPDKQFLESVQNKLDHKVKLLKNETKKINKSRSILEKERIQSERIIISKKLKKQIEYFQKQISGLEKQVAEYKKQVAEYRTLRNKRKNYFTCVLTVCIFIVLLTLTIYRRKLASR
jgi:septal ring factor EnvC (AmiA/AmiB activator)